MYVVILLCLTPLMYAVGVTTGGPLVAVACVMAFFLFAVQPVENTVLARCSPPRLRGRLYGLKFVLVFGLGMGLGTWVSGWLTQDYSLEAVFSTAAAFTAVAIVFAAAAWRIKTAPR